MEQWKEIKGYEGLYEVSNTGKVRSVLLTTGRRPRELKLHMRGFYQFVGLYDKEGKRKQYSIHRLVAEMFISNPNNKPQVNHLDGNKLNNYVSNLEWVNNSENQKHAFKNKLQNSNHCTRKVKCIELDKTYNSIVECAYDLKIAQQNIWKVCKGLRPKAGGYTFIYID